MPRIVTLDGPAGVGKSTLARRVASALGIAYLDTGAMFRTIAATLGAEGLTLTTDEREKALAALAFSLSGCGETSRLACNGRVAGPEIRTEEVGLLASQYAALPEIRACLKQAQQSLGSQFSLVAEGRDMGTEVFPGAKHKFFLDARPETRAKRRLLQLRENGEEADLAVITEQIRKRDEQDRNRAIAPLRPADDAVIVDTSDLDVDGVFAAIMAYLQ